MRIFLWHMYIYGMVSFLFVISYSLTAPSGKAQEQLLLDALDDADIEPAHIDYLETHGTGTALGDPM